MTRAITNPAERRIANRRRRTVWSAAVVIVGLSTMSPTTSSLYAQSSSLLANANAAYEDLDFTAARFLLDGMIESPSQIPVADLARAHLLLGVIDYTEGFNDAARRHFMSAVQLRPGIQPDPATVSPKIIDFFDSVAAEPSPPPANSEVRYVTVVDARPGAALRSVILPGWGQLHKGDRARGYVLGSAWVATAAGAAAMHVSQRQARDQYLDETDPMRVEERYDVFNRRHKARNVLGAAAAVVWLTAYVDALATPGTRTVGGVELAMRPVVGGVTVAAVVPIGR